MRSTSRQRSRQCQQESDGGIRKGTTALLQIPDDMPWVSRVGRNIGAYCWPCCANGMAQWGKGCAETNLMEAALQGNGSFGNLGGTRLVEIGRNCAQVLVLSVAKSVGRMKESR